MPDPTNIILPASRVAFQLICKAGNTSVKWCLIETLCPDTENHQAYSDEPDKVFIYAKKEAIPEAYLKVGFVRDPYERLVSCYKNKIVESFNPNFRAKHPGMFYTGMTFPEFVEAVCEIPDEEADQHFRSFSHDLLPVDKLDIIVRMDYFVEDWKEVEAECARRGLLLKPIGHKNKTEGAFVGDSSLVQKVFHRYEADYNYLRQVNETKQAA